MGNALDKKGHHQHSGHHHQHQHHHEPDGRRERRRVVAQEHRQSDGPHVQMESLDNGSPQVALAGADYSYQPVPQAAWQPLGRFPVGIPDGKSEEDNNSSKSEKDDQRQRQAELKASIFDTYSLCAALLASFCSSVSYIRRSEIEGEDIVVHVCMIIQQFLSRLCTMGAVSAMLVFMFSALYAKTALARPNFGIEVYEKFCKETAHTRTFAFWTMYYTAMLFCLQIATSCWYTFPYYISVAASLILCACFTVVVVHTKQIIKAASIVFMPDDKVELALGIAGIAAVDSEEEEEVSSERSSPRSSRFC